MKKRLLLFLLSTIGFSLHGQPDLLNLQCYKKFMDLGANYLSKERYTEAIHQYKAAIECDGVSSAQRRAAESAIQNAQVAQRRKEEALATRAEKLIGELRGDQTYYEYRDRGIQNLWEGKFQGAIQDFAIARFAKDTSEIAQWLTRAHTVERADSLFWVGEVQEALGYFEKIYAENTYFENKDEGDSDNFGNRSMQECRDILAYQDTIRARGKPIREYSESFRIIPNAVKEFTNSISLSIRSKTLEKLPEWLGDLTNLKNLDISYNSNLSTIPEALGNLTNLTNLVISSNDNLSTIPEALGNLTNLTNLVISSNDNLSTIPEALGNLTNLTNLVISSNDNLSTIPEALGNLKNLEFLELNWQPFLWENTLPKLPFLKKISVTGSSNLNDFLELVQHFPNLGSLIISRNSNLRTLPESLGNLTNLESLVISYNNNLQTIPKSLGNLTNLTSLKINNNDNLSNLPEPIENLKKLEFLELNWQPLLWENVLPKLPFLKKISLTGSTNLEGVPEIIKVFPKLSSLIISNNSDLITLPESLGSLTNLTSLEISRNIELRKLPASLGSLESLESLILSWNFSLWKNSLPRLPFLKEISVIGGGNLVNLPDLTKVFPKLSSLIISNNSDLITLPESLENLTTLTSLEISNNNKLFTLPESIGKLSALQRLIVRDCPLVISLPASLASLPHLRELDISGSGLSRREIENWKKRLPQCNIVTGEK